jgi:hypothetical protein
MGRIVPFRIDDKQRLPRSSDSLPAIFIRRTMLIVMAFYPLEVFKHFLSKGKRQAPLLDIIQVLLCIPCYLHNTILARRSGTLQAT